MKVADYIRVFEIMQQVKPDMVDPVAGADHDVIYLDINNEDLDPESELGKEFQALGPYYSSSEYECWILFA